MGKKLTACVAMVLQQHLERPRGKPAAAKAKARPPVKTKTKAKPGSKRR
jgi:hypothetical protein